MTPADKIAETFDQAKDYTLRLAEEVANERALNGTLEARIRVLEEERDRERRDRLKLIEEFDALESRARQLERDNAVLHSQGEQIVAIWKSGGERIAVSSHLTPEQILHPKPAVDDDLTKEFAAIGKKLSEQRGSYVEQISHTAERSGLAEAAAESSEAVRS